IAHPLSLGEGRWRALERSDGDQSCGVSRRQADSSRVSVSNARWQSVWKERSLRRGPGNEPMEGNERPLLLSSIISRRHIIF
ncbi:hypothetical protein PMAYCL1PPCAC_19056, partial [Pristionchus mayeri]